MTQAASSTWALALLLALAAPALADGGRQLVTLEGKIMCTTCSVKPQDRKRCQKMLVVEDKGETEYYYVEPNAVEHKFGGSCDKVTHVRVRGKLKKKHGQMWITAKEITPVPHGGDSGGT